jgi:hypothetical protein
MRTFPSRPWGSDAIAFSSSELGNERPGRLRATDELRCGKVRDESRSNVRDCLAQPVLRAARLLISQCQVEVVALSSLEGVS